MRKQRKAMQVTRMSIDNKNVTVLPEYCQAARVLSGSKSIDRQPERCQAAIALSGSLARC